MTLDVVLVFQKGKCGLKYVIYILRITLRNLANNCRTDRSD
jgi:hypothetical protein